MNYGIELSSLDEMEKLSEKYNKYYMIVVSFLTKITKTYSL